MDICLVFNPFYHNSSYRADIELLKAALGCDIMPSSIFLPVLGVKRDYIYPEKILFWDKDIVLADYITAKGSRLYNTSECIRICDDKALTHIRLSCCGAAMPQTLLLPFTYSNIGYDNLDFTGSIISELGFPMVVKEVGSSYGMGVFLVNSESELNNIILAKPGRLIAQRYIKTDYDIRVNIVGGNIISAYRRIAGGDFRTNVACGGTVEKHILTAEESRQAIIAAKAVGADFCGVDIIPEGPYVIEVNSNAHMENVNKKFGINIAEYIAEYIKNN